MEDQQYIYSIFLFWRETNSPRNPTQWFLLGIFSQLPVICTSKAFPSQKKNLCFQQPLMDIFPSSSLPKWFLNPSALLAQVTIAILFDNRDQLGKEFWLTGWCLRVTLHEMVDLVFISCLSQKEKGLFSFLSFPLTLPFPHTWFYTLPFWHFLSLQHCFYWSD